MNEEWLAQVIHHLRAIGNDTQQYEVKEAKEDKDGNFTVTILSLIHI